VVVDFILIWRASFIMSLLHVVRQSMDRFIWRSWSVWGRQSEGRGLRGGETRPGGCTCSHVSLRPWIFGEARDDCRPPTAPLSRFGPFLFLRLKSTLKGRRLQAIEEIEENSLLDLRAIPQNAFQNWKKLWKRCIDGGGEYWRRQSLLSCELINKCFKRKVRFIFWTYHVFSGRMVNE
jgi:hypothetical protein